MKKSLALWALATISTAILATYGVLLEESQVLARAVFVIDSTGILRYAELLPEVTFEPDYLAALNALSECCEWPANNEAGDETHDTAAAT
jgi:peroxiredoxin